MTRRPCTKYIRFLAESEAGLDQLIKRETEGKEVLKIDKKVLAYGMIGGCTALVTIKE